MCPRLGASSARTAPAWRCTVTSCASAGRTRRQIWAQKKVDGAVLTADAFVVRFDPAGPHDRLLVVNLGADIDLAPIAEPLLAPPRGCDWIVQWSSEDRAYGGSGHQPLRTRPAFTLRGESAILLRPQQVPTGNA